MRRRGCVLRPLQILVTTVVAGALIAVAPAAASATTCQSSGAQPPNVGTGDNVLIGVAAPSVCNAWAVGYYFSYTSYTLQTLIERWNGTAWNHVASPNVRATNDQLLGVAATSSSNAWAVGFYYAVPLEEQTLIERWNGTSWNRVASPNPGGSSNSNELKGVAATSSTNAWAVGYYYNGTGEQTLILHWDGTSWTRVASPNVGTISNELTGVAATSSTNAWAVGHYFNGTAQQTLILHWNGTAWTRVASPNPGGSSNLNDLSAVAATSSSNAWAVGDYYNGTTFRTLIVHWNGTGWKRQPSPNVGSFANSLFGVSASSSTNAWAVGDYYNGSVNRTLAVHCCWS